MAPENLIPLEFDNNLKPPQIVEELNKYIVGQYEAKRSVAIALVNRRRRAQVKQPLQNEIYPKNMIMIGATGVGKTEIWRRISKSFSYPFYKTEVTKFTEIGYVGRDVESIIRDFMDSEVNRLKQITKNKTLIEAKNAAIERILDALVDKSGTLEQRKYYEEQILTDQINEQEIEIHIKDSSSNKLGSFDIPGIPGAAMGVFNLSDLLSKNLGNDNKTKPRKMKVKEALDLLIAEESDKIINEETIIKDAISSVENYGIIFLDELDKITSRADSNRGSGEISREGVQRDLLPLIEGTTVTTKYGSINTDHILFIAAGAFHLSKPSDLLPELQGRLPIRVMLNPLSKEDMVNILTKPQSNLIVQYKSLLETEKVHLDFSEEALERIADYATQLNKDVENIGARRLFSLMESLLEDISFNAGTTLKDCSIKIDLEFVEKTLSNLLNTPDMARYIL